ncbi:MAG: hypothetical protein NTZ42_04075 [Candidatus Gribaldobacteria bacterium]|nr:hypothetical protein [Candidatus Gribaldobacteria bacterium]
MKNYICLSVIAILLMILMVGCGSDTNTPTISESNAGQAMLAPPVYTEAQINSLILAAAAKDVGKLKGQCKPWVTALIPQAVSGRTIGPTELCNLYYYNAQWNPAGNAKVVWQLYTPNSCITSFPSSLKSGQIIQLRWRPDVAKYWNCCNNGPHTAIIQSVSSTSMQWYDSNFNNDSIVRSHPFSLAQWQKYVVAWTVYQIL